MHHHGPGAFINSLYGHFMQGVAVERAGHWRLAVVVRRYLNRIANLQIQSGGNLVAQRNASPRQRRGCARHGEREL